MPARVIDKLVSDGYNQQPIHPRLTRVDFARRDPKAGSSPACGCGGQQTSDMAAENDTTDDLVPDPALMFDGAGSAAEFIEHGLGFVHNLLVARARLEPPHAVLDIGSGNGQKARALTGFLAAEGRYCGFDVVREGIDWCRARYARFPNFEFTHADLRSDWYRADGAGADSEFRFPYPDRTFDVAFMASVMTHLLPAGLDNYLRESFRVLKPGGRLLATCYLVNEINEGRHAVAVQGLRFRRAGPHHHVLDRKKPSRGVAYDEVYARRRFADAGFVVAELTYGTWANGVDALQALQDTILGVKP